MISAVVLVATGLWHLAAFWHFTLFPARTLARTTHDRPVNALATELFRFLGGLNLALTVLGFVSLAIPREHRWPALVALAVANASQFVVDLRVRRLGMAHGTFFLQILVGDAFFTVANLAALALGG